MSQDVNNEIALMRYAVIAPLISGLRDSDKSLKSFFQEASLKKYKTFDGRLVTVKARTIERWYYLYRKDGLDGLMPKGRSDSGVYRKLDEDTRMQIEYYKKEFPRISATLIYNKLMESGQISTHEVSLSTVTRFVNHLKRGDDSAPSKEMKRYELENVNDVWYADTTQAFHLTIDGKKKRVYIIAFQDDRSRYITGIDAFFNDNFVNVMKVMKSAVSKHGRPKMFSFDNGSPYKNGQMELLTARLGSVLNWTQPYSPQSKGKTERFFKTLKQQWLSGVRPADFSTLEEFRTALKSYVYRYNVTPHRGIANQTPKDVFFDDTNFIQRVEEDRMNQIFLLELDRRVSIDNVIKIDKIEYEVPSRYSRQKIKLRYSPDLNEVYVSDEHTGTLEKIDILRKTDNSKIKRTAYQFKGEN